MQQGIYKIADHIVEIRSLYENVHRLCDAYRWQSYAACDTLTEPELSMEDARPGTSEHVAFDLTEGLDALAKASLAAELPVKSIDYAPVRITAAADGQTVAKSSVVCITTTAEDISYERERSAQTDRAEGREVREFSDGYLETLAVYRKLVLALLEDDFLLMHGSAIAVDGEAYIFIAKSGTGKSTHTRLWREMLGDRTVMVNDDKPLIHVLNAGSEGGGIHMRFAESPVSGLLSNLQSGASPTATLRSAGSSVSGMQPKLQSETTPAAMTWRSAGSSVSGTQPKLRPETSPVAMIYGTPWDGKHHLSSNIAVPLKAICILERAEENRIREVSRAEALPYMMQQIYRPKDACGMQKTLELIEGLSASVRLYRLGCNMDLSAARVAYEGMC